MPDRLPHAAAVCQWCEPVQPEAYRRHWKRQPKVGAWHVIADGPDLIARLPHPAHFLTALCYRPSLDGSPAHYGGALYWEFDATDLAKALNELRRCIQILDLEYGCPPEALRLWLSGGRGFHITVPPIVIGAEAGYPQLPRVYAAMIQRLFPPTMAPTLDRSVYNMGKGRMWRLPNRRRSDTGRYKVPLAMREVLHQPSAALEALTIRPRTGLFWPPEPELSPCPALVQVYQEAMASLAHAAPPSSPRHEGGRIPQGQRNATLAGLAGSMRRRDASEAAIAAALLAENRLRCDPPLPDEEVRRIAVSIARYAPAAPAAAAARAGDGALRAFGGIRTIAATEVLRWR